MLKLKWADNTVRFDYVDRSVFSEDIEIPEHWHEEIEINYTMTGRVKEYIIDLETEYVHGSGIYCCKSISSTRGS